MNIGEKSKVPSRLDGNGFLASKDGSRLVPSFLFRRTMLRASSWAIRLVAVICIFWFIDPARVSAHRRSGSLSKETYQLLPTILMPFASAIL